MPLSLIGALVYLLIWFRFIGEYGRIITVLLLLIPIILITVKRLRSFGANSWWALVMFLPIPYAAAIFYIALGFIPDKEQTPLDL